VLGAIAGVLGGCCPVLYGPTHCPAAFVPSAFSQRYACPEGRISTRERPDLPYHRFVCPRAEACEEHPPAELAGDPERIALWRRVTYGGTEGPAERLDEHATVTLEVSGCGVRRFYACTRVYRRGRAPVDCAGSALLDLGAKEP
jgi:hypothetical protein